MSVLAYNPIPQVVEVMPVRMTGWNTRKLQRGNQLFKDESGDLVILLDRDGVVLTHEDYSTLSAAQH